MKKYFIVSLLMMQVGIMHGEGEEAPSEPPIVVTHTKPSHTDGDRHPKSWLDTLKGHISTVGTTIGSTVGRVLGSKKNTGAQPDDPVPTKPSDTHEADLYKRDDTDKPNSSENFSLGDNALQDQEEDDTLSQILTEEFHDCKTMSVEEFTQETGMSERELQQACDKSGVVSAEQLEKAYDVLHGHSPQISDLDGLQDPAVTDSLREHLKKEPAEMAQLKKGWVRNLRLLERTKNFLKKTKYYLSPVRIAHGSYIVVRSVGKVIKKIVKISTTATGYFFLVSLPLIVDAHRLTLGVGTLGLYIFGEMYIHALIKNHYEYVKQSSIYPDQEIERKPVEIDQLNFSFVTDKGIDLFNKLLSKLYGPVKLPEDEVITITLEAAKTELNVNDKEFNTLCDQHEVGFDKMSAVYDAMSKQPFDVKKGLQRLNDSSIVQPLADELSKHPEEKAQLKQKWPRAQAFLRKMSSLTHAAGSKLSVIPGAKFTYCVIRGSAIGIREIIKFSAGLTSYTFLVYAPLVIDNIRVGAAAAGLGTYIFGEMYIRAVASRKIDEINNLIMHPTQEYVPKEAPQFNRLDFPFVTTKGIRLFNKFIKFLYPPKAKKSVDQTEVAQPAAV